MAAYATPGAHSGASVGSPTGRPSIDRLDRILALVTDHEARSRDQDAIIAQLGSKLAELETSMGQEWAPLWQLKVGL